MPTREPMTWRRAPDSLVAVRRIRVTWTTVLLFAVFTVAMVVLGAAVMEPLEAQSVIHQPKGTQ